MDASVKKIMVDLKAGKYAPVYFLQGGRDVLYRPDR